MNRLSSGEGDTETYDELSNLVTRGEATYQYQDPDEDDCDQMRLAKFTSGTEYDYTYDANGNPTSVTNRFTSLAYDNLNMLRQIVHGQIDNYWYNSAGLRVKRIENAGGTWTTTYTLYEGDNILMQEVYTSSGRIQVIFNIIVNGQILAQYKRVYPSTNSTVYFYLDNLNSRRVVIDSSGNELDRYRYSAWGMVTQDEGSDNYQSFTGKDYDASGLIYFNARYYDPMTGRFLTEDKSKAGGNWYTYCRNNTLNFIDPNGQEPVQRQAGTIDEFITIMNDIRSASRSGLKVGKEADLMIQEFSATTGIIPKPISTPYFNDKAARYIYTTKAGWIDMVHFLFYAGLARKLKVEGSQDPILGSFTEGYKQELADQLTAPHSAFSYEDLPSDLAGAIFGAIVFNPNIKENLGEQVKQYLLSLGATRPLFAPNWFLMPFRAEDVKKPTWTNQNARPMFTIEEPILTLRR